MQHSKMNSDASFFVENDSNYHCLCGLSNVVTGVKVFLSIFIITGCSLVFQDASFSGIPFAFIVVVIIVAACTISAIINEDHTLLWAFVIVTFVEMVAITLSLLAASYIFYCNKDFGEEWLADYLSALEDNSVVINDNAMTSFYAGLVVFCLIAFAYCTWVLRVLIACKSYFKGKQSTTVESSFNSALQPTVAARFPSYTQDAPPPYQAKH